jgi:hypothetical protein
MAAAAVGKVQRVKMELLAGLVMVAMALLLRLRKVLPTTVVAAAAAHQTLIRV